MQSNREGVRPRATALLLLAIACRARSWRPGPEPVGSCQSGRALPQEIVEESLSTGVRKSSHQLDLLKGVEEAETIASHNAIASRIPSAATRSRSPRLETTST